MIAKKLFLILLLPVLSGAVFASDVKIIRTLPATSENTVKATWSKPQAKPERAVGAGRTQFSGRLALGGSGGLDVSGGVLYDMFSDSSFSLVQPLGLLGNMSVFGTALRKSIIEGHNQDYSGKFNLILDKLRFSAGVSYVEKANVVDVINKDDASTLITASIDANYIDTLPLSLSYTHGIVHKKQGETAADEIVEDYDGDDLNFKMIGGLGELGVDLISSYSRKNDKAKSMISNGFSSSLAVTSPLLGFVKVKASVVPVISTVVYTATGKKLASTTLDSDLGLIFPLSESFTVTTAGGRYDSWVSDTIAAKTYTNGWKASTGFKYRVKDSMSEDTNYQIKISRDIFQHQLTSSFGLSGIKDSWFRKADINVELNQNYNSERSLTDNKIGWGSFFGIEPINKMDISGKYSGSVNGITELNWINSVSAGLKHEPDPMFNYGVTTELSDSLKTASGKTESNILKQNYGGTVTLKPQRNLKVYSFGLGELFSLNSDLVSAEASVSNPDMLSKLDFNMGVPVFSFLQTRYSLSWEWSTLYSETKNAEIGNNFQHVFGITVSGDPVPLTFTATYSLSHGTRGMRHDVTSNLTIPFKDSFSLDGNFSLSYYTENNVTKVPFLAGLSIAYEF